MNILFNELAMHEDENYIYLDKDGKAQKRVEVTVHWDSIPNKRILVTCNSNDSLSYLRSMIGEVMEKFTIFSGLTNLQATNLLFNRSPLPDSGLVSDYLTSGDHLTCEIYSLDLWLEVKIEAEELGLLIFLDIKAYNNKRVSIVKKSLLDISNQIFKSRSLSKVYEDSDAVLKKIEVSEFGEVLNTDPFNVLGTQTKLENLAELNERAEVGKTFTYLDRFVYLKLAKQQEEDPGFPVIRIDEITNAESLSQIASTAPVRNIRVEFQTIKKTYNRRSSNKEGKLSRYPEKNNCNCLLI